MRIIVLNKGVFIPGDVDAGGVVVTDDVRHLIHVKALHLQIVDLMKVMRGGGGGGQILCVGADEVAVCHLLGGVIEIGVEGIFALVVPGDVGIVPLTVQLYQVPGVPHQLTVGGEAAAGDVPGGDTHPLHQQLIGVGVAGAHSGALYQRAIGGLMLARQLVEGGGGQPIVEQAALFIVALAREVGGQCGHAGL